MLGRIYPLAVLLVFAGVLTKASCTEKGSLTFVIDDTLSMKDDINQIKSSIIKTLSVFNETSSVSDIVVVTFNNTDAQLVAKNSDEVDTALKDIKALSKNDPRNQVLSMEGLILALENSNRGSHIYVFTDASAKDHQKARIVKELCQEKQSQIYFMITGSNTKHYQDGSMATYNDIAETCSGLVYVVNKLEASKVFRLISNIVIGEEIVVYQKNFPVLLSKYNYIQFNVDQLTKDLTISMTGKNLNRVFNKDLDKSRDNIETDNFKVYNLMDVKPGKHFFKVKSESETSVVITGRSDFFFKHGFSELMPKSLNDTFLQPIADANVHLSVLVSDVGKSVEIIKAQILGMHGKPITPDLNLTNISKDFYVTPPFVTPKQRFRVVVNGRLKGSKDCCMMRFAKIPVTPLNLRDNRVLKVVIADGKEISVEYNTSLKLTCKVTAFPKPKISWLNKQGQTIDSKSSMVKYPYDYISYLEVSMLKDDQYTCSATNDIGLKSTSIAVKVKDTFTVVNTPSRAEFKYGKPGTLKCDIKSSLPINIRWYHLNEMSGIKKQVLDSKDYSISADKTELKIIKMDVDLDGKYVCQAYLVNDKKTQMELSKIVEITGLVAPKVQTHANKIGIKGAPVVLECNVTGIPMPTIKWQFRGKSGSKFEPLGETGSVLRISNVEAKHEGQYKCVAENTKAKNENITTLFIQEKPKIKGVGALTIKLGLPVDIVCRVVEGFPKPNITWFVNNSGKKFKPIAGTLDVMHIAKAEHKHTGRYKCVAQNEAGKAEHITSLTVELRPVIVTKSKSVEIIEGDAAIKIPCKVIGGPQPAITWKINDTIIKANGKYSFSEGSLIIQNPNKTEIGNYTCEAKNKLGSTNAVIEVTFEKRPSTFGTKHFVYLLYGENKNIECKAYRSKSQTLKWFDNEGELNKKSIQITKASVSNDGNYTCHVSDKQGHTETHTYIVNVGGPPKLLADNPLNDWRGEIQEIQSNCDSDAKPQATVQWKYNGKVIPDSDVQDLGVIYKWGHYTCNVSNPHGFVLKEFDVNSSVCLIPKNLKDAGYMPLPLNEDGTWANWKTSKYFFVVDAGEIITLSCPNSTDAPNSFKIFPTKTEIKANCSKEDKFVVDAGMYKVSELQCNNKYYFTNNAERIRFWFASGSFSSYGLVCFYFFLFIFYYYL
ncbi:hemicentin-1-like [Spodoptera frugiperda]|uniref:Hemolin n=1 Tax=Spodoptera frugiperda TaxID=7108 RepID=A0A9R0EWA6_SPOFR|nr:hemicentin-1-like [Spodoptera frugiperda]